MKNQENNKQTISRALEPDGLADQILARTRKVNGEDAQSIRREWKAEVKRLRTALTRPDSAKARFLSDHVGQGLDRPLRDPESDGPTAFLRFLLAKQVGVQCEKMITQLALKEYRERPRLYDRLSGKFLGDDVKKPIRAERYEADENPTVAADWKAFADVLQDKLTIQSNHLATGIKPLDRLIGGLSQLTLLAGPTGSGKTTLALNLAVGVIQQNPDVCVLFLSAELSKTRLYQKLLSCVSRVPYTRLSPSSKRSPDEEEAVSKACDSIEQNLGKRLRIVDKRARVPLLLKDVKSLIDETRDATRCGTCLVIIDSLDRLVLGERRDFDGEYQICPKGDVTDEDRLQFLLGLQHWTRNSGSPDGWPVIAITRTRKGSGGDRQLERDDVFGTVDLAYDARTVLLLQPWGSTKETHSTSVRLAVAKVGDEGECGECRLIFRHTVNRFDEAPATSRMRSTAAETVACLVGGRNRLRDKRKGRAD